MWISYTTEVNTGTAGIIIPAVPVFIEIIVC